MPTVVAIPNAMAGPVRASAGETAPAVVNPGEASRFYTFLLSRPVGQLWDSVKDLG